MCCKCRNFIEQNQKVSVGIAILQPDTPENEDKKNADLCYKTYKNV